MVRMAAVVGGAAREMGVVFVRGPRQGGGSDPAQRWFAAADVVRISLPWREGSIKGRRRANPMPMEKPQGEGMDQAACPHPKLQSKPAKRTNPPATRHSLSGSCGFATRDGVTDAAGVELQLSWLGCFWRFLGVADVENEAQPTQLEWPPGFTSNQRVCASWSLPIDGCSNSACHGCHPRRISAPTSFSDSPTETATTSHTLATEPARSRAAPFIAAF